MTARNRTHTVTWASLLHHRDFSSLDAAERFARSLVATGKGSGGDVEIHLIGKGARLAVINKDALDRVWTDLCVTPGRKIAA